MHENIQYLVDRGWKPTGKSTTELRGCCPFLNHKDSNPSFSINQVTGAFNCKGCNNGGRSLATLMIHCEGLTLEEARERLGQASNPAPHIADINQRVGKYCHAVLTYPGDFKNTIQTIRSEVKTYLKKRGYDPEQIIEKHQIGYTYKGLPEKFGVGDLNEAKLMLGPSYYTRDRLAIPITYHKSTIGFSLRAMYPTTTKYLNVYNPEIYPSSRWLAGLDQSAGESVIVVEGIFDMIRLKEYGHDVCALMGTSLNEDRIGLLKGYKTVYLMLDHDKAGMDAMEKIFFMSRRQCKESVFKICSLPEGKDPDDCSLNEIEWSLATSKSAFEWITSRYLYSCSFDEHVASMQRLKAKVVNYINDPHEQNLFVSAIEDQIMNASERNKARYNNVRTVYELLAAPAMFSPHPAIEFSENAGGFELKILNYIYQFDKDGHPISSSTLGPEHLRWTIIRG